jgi:hypothetical protein
VSESEEEAGGAPEERLTSYGASYGVGLRGVSCTYQIELRRSWCKNYEEYDKNNTHQRKTRTIGEYAILPLCITKSKALFLRNAKLTE